MDEAPYESNFQPCRKLPPPFKRLPWAGLPDRLTRLVAGVPMGRTGSAAEVAEAVLWLASDAASYISGAIIPISGAR